jgi:Na+-driven multidrug efflux pump
MTRVRSSYSSPAANDPVVSPSRLDVVGLVASILPIVALFQVFDALNGVAGGIMRARGKQVNFRVSPFPE